jgi:antirestriction protein ArdC
VLPVLLWSAQHATGRITKRHGGNQAYYAIGQDHIQLPPFESFRDAESYYATLAHGQVVSDNAADWKESNAG